MDKIIPFPGEKPDIQEMMINGKPELALSARGVVLFYLDAWREESNQKAHDGLRLYCEYITLHGYQGGASKALKELDGMDKDAATAWIKRTFAQYVQDQNALMEYILSILIDQA